MKYLDIFPLENSEEVIMNVQEGVLRIIQR